MYDGMFFCILSFTIGICIYLMMIACLLWMLNLFVRTMKIRWHSNRFREAYGQKRQPWFAGEAGTTTLDSLQVSRGPHKLSLQALSWPC